MKISEKFQQPEQMVIWTGTIPTATDHHAPLWPLSILPWNASFLLLPATGPLTADEVFIIHGWSMLEPYEICPPVTPFAGHFPWERLGNTMVFHISIPNSSASARPQRPCATAQRLGFGAHTACHGFTSRMGDLGSRWVRPRNDEDTAKLLRL
jgi:hypothetical protein